MSLMTIDCKVLKQGRNIMFLEAVKCAAASEKYPWWSIHSLKLLWPY